ncbi:hypothetical protein FOZ62_018335, partial [Perkinsus olseni]
DVRGRRCVCRADLAALRLLGLWVFSPAGQPSAKPLLRVGGFLRHVHQFPCHIAEISKAGNSSCSSGGDAALSRG